MKRKVTAQTIARLKDLRKKYGLGEFAPSGRRKKRAKASRILPRGKYGSSILASQSFLP